MSRGMLAVVRFVIGIACIALVFKFLGVTWQDVDYFIDNGLKSSLEVINIFKASLADI